MPFEIKSEWKWVFEICPSQYRNVYNLGLGQCEEHSKALTIMDEEKGVVTIKINCLITPSASDNYIAYKIINTVTIIII